METACIINEKLKVSGLYSGASVNCPLPAPDCKAFQPQARKMPRTISCASKKMMFIRAVKVIPRRLTSVALTRKARMKPAFGMAG
ncbi:hypothetical protein D3C73_1234400 [compost metagenome]